MLKLRNFTRTGVEAGEFDNPPPLFYARRAAGSWSDFPCRGTVLVNCWSAVGHRELGLELEGRG